MGVAREENCLYVRYLACNKLLPQLQCWQGFWQFLASKFIMNCLGFVHPSRNKKMTRPAAIICISCCMTSSCHVLPFSGYVSGYVSLLRSCLTDQCQALHQFLQGGWANVSIVGV